MERDRLVPPTVPSGSHEGTRPKTAFSRDARRAVRRSADALVSERPIASRPLPWVFEAKSAEVDLATWGDEHRARIDARLIEHGAVLFRGFGIDDVTAMNRAVRSMSGELLPYHERTGPRTSLHDAIYTSTDYPAEYEIFLHNENSYSRRMPGRLSFACLVPPLAAGETALADCRAVERRIDRGLLERFAELGWMHVRNIAPELGLGWRDVFQCETREEVARYCTENGIGLEWTDTDRLRTRQVHDAFVVHPITGERLFCNHATFYHGQSLEPVLRQALGAGSRDDRLPNHTRFGDGSAISRDQVRHLREAYVREKTTFPWRRGDLLVVDNLRVCHGREPYRGPRRIAVAMTTPFERPPWTSTLGPEPR